MKYLEVTNWDQLQHYKDRRPPWIKLYNDLLHDYEFSRLQDASKLHLILTMLLASQIGNRIPYDEAWITAKIGVSEPVDLQPLIDAGFIAVVDDASNMLAGCKQSACLETETETETEKRQKGARKKFVPPSLADVTGYVREAGLTIDPQGFIDYYESNGWKVGKNQMRDWKATVRNWSRRDKKANIEPVKPRLVV